MELKLITTDHETISLPQTIRGQNDLGKVLLDNIPRSRMDPLALERLQLMADAANGNDQN